MGGVPPLGYRVQDRKLVIVDSEAEIVRSIFRRYAELGSVRLLKAELEVQGRKSESWTSRAVGDESASRNRKFESTPLQRRVCCEPAYSFPSDHWVCPETSLPPPASNLRSEGLPTRRLLGRCTNRRALMQTVGASHPLASNGQASRALLMALWREPAPPAHVVIRELWYI
jgi:hypothetical protein